MGLRCHIQYGRYRCLHLKKTIDPKTTQERSTRHPAGTDADACWPVCISQNAYICHGGMKGISKQWIKWPRDAQSDNFTSCRQTTTQIRNTHVCTRERRYWLNTGKGTPPIKKTRGTNPKPSMVGTKGLKQTETMKKALFGPASSKGRTSPVNN